MLNFDVGKNPMVKELEHPNEQPKDLYLYIFPTINQLLVVDIKTAAVKTMSIEEILTDEYFARVKEAIDQVFEKSQKKIEKLIALWDDLPGITQRQLIQKVSETLGIAGKDEKLKSTEIGVWLNDSGLFFASEEWVKTVDIFNKKLPIKAREELVRQIENLILGEKKLDTRQSICGGDRFKTIWTAPKND